MVITTGPLSIDVLLAARNSHDRNALVVKYRTACGRSDEIGSVGVCPAIIAVYRRRARWYDQDLAALDARGYTVLEAIAAEGRTKGGRGNARAVGLAGEDSRTPVW
jgi:hypothetical protein